MFTYKVVLLGDEGVGKTSIAKRIKENKFSLSVEATIGCEFFAKKYGEYKLLFWDTAGQEVFKAFTPQFSRGDKKIQEYSNMLPLDAIVIVAFTKADLVDESFKLPVVYLDLLNKGYVNENKISCKEGKNVEKLEEMILEKIKEHIPRKNEIFHNVDINEERDERFCCKIN